MDRPSSTQDNRGAVARRVGPLGWFVLAALAGCGAASPEPEAAACEGWPRLRAIREGPGAGHHLAYGDQPILPLGDSITQGWSECGADLDQEAYLRALARRGIRAVHLWSFIAPSPGGDDRIGYDAPAILPWPRTAPGRWDLGRDDEAYYARLEALCRLARELAIVVVIQVFDGWPKTRFATHPFNAANGGPLTDRSELVELARYGEELPAEPDPAWSRRERNQYVQERFAARLIPATSRFGNVGYELFNEGEWYDAELRRKHELHFLAFFKARCSNPLLTNADHIRGADFRREPNVDAITHHRPGWACSTTAREVFDHYRTQFEGEPPRPFIFTEPVPEFRGAEECEVDAMMRVLWGAALGGAGCFVQNDASFGFDPKAKVASRARLRDAVLDREGVCSRFFNSGWTGWASMAPAPEVSSTGVALLRPGHEWVVYCESGADFTLDLSSAPGVPIDGRFLDPRSGEWERPISRIGGRPDERIAKPDRGDWVFWGRRAAGR